MFLSEVRNVWEVITNFFPLYIWETAYLLPSTFLYNNLRSVESNSELRRKEYVQLIICEGLQGGTLRNQIEINR